jgi:hypothetical protein
LTKDHSNVSLRLGAYLPFEPLKGGAWMSRYITMGLVVLSAVASAITLAGGPWPF